MSRKRQPRGYRVHGLDSPKGQTELTRQGLTKADLERVLAAFARAEQTRIGTLTGITEDGVFGSDREGRSPASLMPSLSRC
jgi:hypothetical protein